MKIINKKKGSILILVLWALGLLTVFAVYLGGGLRQRLDFIARLETRNKLYHIAAAGVKLAVSEIGNLADDACFISLKDRWSFNNAVFAAAAVGEGVVTVGYPYNAQELAMEAAGAEGLKVMYGAQDVQSRININTAERQELRRLFEKAADLDEKLADEIACSIIDWRDADNQSLPNGAEDGYYHSLRVPYECKDAAFQAIEELAYIKGMEPLVLQRVKPYITIYGQGSVNINTVYRTVLFALGLDDSLINKVIAFRCGADKVEATPDDQVFTSVDSIVAQLSQADSLSPSEAAQLSNLVSGGKFSVFSDTFMIQAEAILAQKPQICRIICVFRKSTSRGESTQKAGSILHWQVGYFNPNISQL